MLYGLVSHLLASYFLRGRATDLVNVHIDVHIKVHYDVHMIKPITSAEFRKSMKTFLDAAHDKDIYIGRNWELFKLTYVGNAFGDLPEETRAKLATQPKREAAVKPVIADILPEKLLNTVKPMCKGGHFLDSRGRCLQKDCKYS